MECFYDDAAADREIRRDRERLEDRDGGWRDTGMPTCTTVEERFY